MRTGRDIFRQIGIRGSGYLYGWIRPDGPVMACFQGAIGAFGPHCVTGSVGDTFLRETEPENAC
jgi:hypothetical protein